MSLSLFKYVTFLFCLFYYIFNFPKHLVYVSEMILIAYIQNRVLLGFNTCREWCPFVAIQFRNLSVW